MSRRDKVITYIMIFLVILPGGISFFIKVGSYFMVEVEEGMSGFALPFFNYLFVALGFVSLFVWAFLRGHFRDINRPSQEMLEMERSFEDSDLREDEGRGQTGPVTEGCTLKQTQQREV